MDKAKVKEMLKKWGPYILVAVIAGAVGANSIGGCECGKNARKGQKISKEFRMGKRMMGSAGDRGEGRWMRDEKSVEARKERMKKLKEKKAEKQDAANQEG